MYRYVIFDLDGTLIDTSLGTVKCFKTALDYLGIEMSEKRIRSYIGPPFTRTLVNEFEVAEEDARKAMDLGHEYLATRGYMHCFTFEGMKETLECLRKNGIRMAVATSQPEATAVLEAEFVQISDYFECFEANNEYQTRGTKSDFVGMCIEALEIDDLSEAVMIGDKSPDIRGGKDNGLDTIGVLYGYGEYEEISKAEPDYIIRKPEEIIDIILSK